MSQYRDLDKMAGEPQPNPYVLIEQAQAASFGQELDSVIDALVKLGEPAVEALLERMPRVVTSRLHGVGARVFARVGYPANAKALRFMVSDVSNVNSMTYEVSLAALLEIGTAVLPEVEEALDYYREHTNEEFNNALEIDSLEDLKTQIVSRSNC